MILRGMLVAGAMVAALLGSGASAVAAPGAKLPVPYALPDSIALEQAHPGASPPGSNDWSCRPTAAHPEPVVLVHGSSANKQMNWQTYAPLLANEGYCVYALTYGAYVDGVWPIDALGGMASMDGSTGQLAAFVDRVLASTGAQKVDLVGHSQGTLVSANYTLLGGGVDKVKRVVSMAPLWRGTDVSKTTDLLPIPREYLPADLVRAGFDAACPACAGMQPGSPFLTRLASAGTYARNVEYTNILTRYDGVVTPYTNGYLDAPNAKNIVLQDVCPKDDAGHLPMVADRPTAQLVLDALDPARARGVDCSS